MVSDIYKVNTLRVVFFNVYKLYETYNHQIVFFYKITLKTFEFKVQWGGGEHILLMTVWIYCGGGDLSFDIASDNVNCDSDFWVCNDMGEKNLILYE